MRTKFSWLIAMALSVVACTASGQVVSERSSVESTLPKSDRVASCIAASRQRSGRFYYECESDDVVNTITISQCPDSDLLFVGEENERVVGIGLLGSLGSVIETRKEQALLRVIDMRKGEEIKRIPCGKATGIFDVSATLRGDNVAAVSRNVGSEVVARQLSLRAPLPTLTIANSITGELLGTHPNFDWKHIRYLDNANRAFVSKSSGVGLVDMDAPSSKPVWTQNLDVDVELAPCICPKLNVVLVPCLGRNDEDSLFRLFRLSDGQMAPTTYCAKDIPSAYGGRRVSVLATSRDEKLAAVGCDGFLIVMDLSTGVEVRRLGLGDVAFEDRSPLCVHFADDNKTIDVVWSKDWNGTRWNLESGEKVLSVRYAGPPLEFSHNGQCLFLESETGTIDVADASTGLQLLKLYLFHSDRRWLVETIDGYCAASTLLQDEEQLLLTDAGLTVDPTMVNSLLKELLTENQDTPELMAESEPSKSKEHAYILSYGVSRHKYPEYDLKYAATDANDFVKVFQRSATRTFQEIRYESKLNEDVTVDSIRQGLAWLERSTTENDTAVIFFSGHGVKGRNGLYFVPHGGDFQAMQYTCLNWSEVAQSVAKLKAKNIVMLVDCCHAGAFGRDLRTSNAELTAELKSRKGFYLLCSSSGQEVSLENDQSEHGAFTQAVIESLSQTADSNGDQSVSFGEFTTYVKERVSELTNGEQHPTLLFENSIDLNQSFVKLQQR